MASEKPSGGAVRLEVLAADAEPTRTIDPPGPVDPGPATTTDRVIAAVSGSLADRMRARYAQVRADTTHDFRVPGWSGDLVLRARLVGKDEVTQWATAGSGDDNWIIFSTIALLFRDEEGLAEIEGGWGPALAQLLAMPADTPPTRLVAAVMNDSPMRTSGFAQDILDWNTAGTFALEAELGE